MTSFEGLPAVSGGGARNFLCIKLFTYFLASTRPPAESLWWSVTSGATGSSGALGAVWA